MSEDQQLTLNQVSESNTGPKAAHIENSAFGDIPEDWTWEKTEEHLEYIESGISESQNKDGEGIPVSRIETIANGTVNYQKVGYVNGDKDYSKHRLKPGDLLFSNINSRDEIGKTAIYRGEQPLYHGMNLLRLRYDSNAFNPYFAYYIYDSPMAQDVFFRMSKAAVGQSSINQSQMERLFLPTPPLPEQRKIATVLYTVDQAIEKTDEIIERSNKLKKGLRQDIFQHGGLSGEKTTTRRIGPKRYEMPEDWKVTNLSQVAEINGGQGFKSSNYVDEGVPLIKISNIQNGFLDLQDTSYLPEEYLNEYNEAALSEGDVVLVLTRPIIGDGIKAARIEQNDRFLLNQRLAVVDPIDEDNITREYLYHLIFTNVFIDQVKATVRATHQPNLSKTDLQNFSIPVPEIEQQRDICRLLRSVEQVVEKNKSYRSNLKRMKYGLMQDLLSGTVRTTDTNIEVPEEIAQYG